MLDMILKDSLLTSFLTVRYDFLYPIMTGSAT